ncbi:MAG: hypothetical protein ACREMY_32060, partial [bacterium]
CDYPRCSDLATSLIFCAPTDRIYGCLAHSEDHYGFLPEKFDPFLSAYWRFVVENVDFARELPSNARRIARALGEELDQDE